MFTGMSLIGMVEALFWVCKLAWWIAVGSKCVKGREEKENDGGGEQEEESRTPL